MRTCLVYTTHSAKGSPEKQAAEYQELAKSLEALNRTVEAMQLPLTFSAEWSVNAPIRHLRAIAETTTVQTAWSNLSAHLKTNKTDVMVLDVRRNVLALPLELVALIPAAMSKKFSTWKMVILASRKDFQMLQRLLKIPLSDKDKYLASTPEELRALLQRRQSAIRMARELEQDMRRCERRYGSRFVDDFD